MMVGITSLLYIELIELYIITSLLIIELNRCYIEYTQQVRYSDCPCIWIHFIIKNYKISSKNLRSERHGVASRVQ